MNFTHSIKSNCEEDESTPLLTNLKNFFLNCDISNETASDDSDDDDDESETALFDPLHIFSNTDDDFITDEAIANAGSSLCDKLLKSIKCTNCRETLEADEEYGRKTLKRPSDAFTQNFKKVLNRVSDLLPDACTEKFLKRKIVDQLKDIDIDVLGCADHHTFIEEKFKELVVHYGVVTFTKSINDLLRGKTKVLPPNYNYLEELAFIYNQKRKIGKYSDKLNQM